MDGWISVNNYLNSLFVHIRNPHKSIVLNYIEKELPRINKNYIKNMNLKFDNNKVEINTIFYKHD